MEYKWIEVKDSGVLNVPDLPANIRREALADYMWLVVNSREELVGFPVCDKYETGWWAKMLRWYAVPLRSLGCLWPGNDNIAPWTKSTERLPETPGFFLVLDTDSYEMRFLHADDIEAGPSVYWYNADITATPFRRKADG